MARRTSKSEESEPSSATVGGQQAKPIFWPVFRESNQHISCCPTLLQAARVSHLKCVTWHLRHGDSLAQTLRHQHARVQRPLHEAAGAKPLDDGRGKPRCTLCVEMMLAAGSRASWLDENGRSSLERAAMVGCVPCIETLFHPPTTGATTDNADAICDQQSKALVEAARINSEASVRALLSPASATSAGPVDLLPCESRLGPALIEAVKEGAYDCITPLVEAGAALNPVGDPSDDSSRLVPLLAAAGRKGIADKETDGRVLDVLRLLVKLGAAVNTQSLSDGRSALHVSASNGRCDCVQALLELGANPMSLDNDGESPLHCAASSHHAEACRLLVNHITEASGTATAAAALLVKNKRDRSPLHSAVLNCGWESNPEVTSCTSTLLRLLEASGGSEAVAGALRDKSGYYYDHHRTVLHSAAGNRHADLFKVLIEPQEGLRVALEVEDGHGKTPLALARQVGHDFDDIPAFAQVPFVPCCSGLVEAMKEGHVACVKHTLKDGLSKMGAADAAESEDLDPLALVSHCCGRRCSTIVRHLLEAGFHPNGRHGDFVPLQNATWDGHCMECTRLLIEAGAGGLFSCGTNDVGEEHFPMWAILNQAAQWDGSEEIPQFVKCALEACDIRDDEGGVTDLIDWVGRRNTKLPRLLVDAGADITRKYKDGRTALHMAAGLLELYWYGDEDDSDDIRDSDQHAELVGWLVSQGAMVDARDNNGNTPMHVAASLGLSKVVAVLLDLGADPLLQRTSGDNSLHIASLAGSTTLMARFIDLGIDVNAKGDDGNTALHLASQKGDPSCVRMLLDEGADLNRTNGFGWTPLRFAAAYERTAKALECLLDSGKGDLHQTVHGVGGLLHSAAYHGSTAGMQLLVNRGLDIGAIDSKGETVVHKAAQNGGGLAVKWLLDNGATLDVEDHRDRTPQTCAVVEGTNDVQIRSALEAIAESNDGKRAMSIVWDGWSLLHLAASKGFEYCVRFLVSNGAEVHGKTADGDDQTAMHCAVSNARDSAKGVIRALAKFGACVDARDSSGRTPLHLAAAAEDQLQVATGLIELGASCNIADKKGRTPLWAAAKKGNLACCSLLVARGADVALRDIQGSNALGASLVGSHSTKTNREKVLKLLIELGCPVGELEVDAASRGGLTDSFAKAITTRMSGGAAARGLVKATGDWSSAEGVGGVLSAGAEPAVSRMMAVRVSSEPPPKFSSRRRRASSTSSKVAAISSKVYHVDRLRLREAVSHLEGPDDVGKCLLLKLLLPPPAGWSAEYRGDASGGLSGVSSAGLLADCQVERPGSSPSDAVLASPVRRGTPCMSEVELSCNGDDFDEAGFEAVMEYLSTGQVVGATCGSIHGEDGSARGNNGATRHEVGAHAIAAHRAAAFFGLPRLQSMVRAWLEANGVEMEDDGTGVLSEPAGGSSGDVSKKRKFAG